ncbi:MAG: hypothetical protein ACYSX0_21645 [Planctomycetota bacterium]|jgi:TATA-box binding protein (TBP) (component of TFIID and TFIIIB)
MHDFSDPLTYGDAKASRKRFPLILGAFAALIAVVGVVYMSGAAERDAREMVAGIGPEEMANKLFANETLPDVIPISVRGVLDLRLNHCEYEYAELPGVTARVKKLRSCKVYGLLYPADSPVSGEGYRVTDLAESVKPYADASDIDNEEYSDLWDELSATYEELCDGPAILVEVNPEKYPELYRQAEEESLLLVNNRGRMLAAGTVAVAHRNMANRLLNPRYLIDGTFKVQVTEHNGKVADMIQGDDFTGSVRIVRTVAGPR